MATGIQIEKCADKSWSDESPHKIIADGWDGQGGRTIEIPLTDNELDEVIRTLVDYRNANPREV
jgi:hypothetical protein